jgi:hypothetical protein
VTTDRRLREFLRHRAPSHRVQSSTAASRRRFIAFVSKSHCF